MTAQTIFASPLTLRCTVQAAWRQFQVALKSGHAFHTKYSRLERLLQRACRG